MAFSQIVHPSRRFFLKPPKLINEMRSITRSVSPKFSFCSTTAITGLLQVLVCHALRNVHLFLITRLFFPPADIIFTNLSPLD